VRFWMSVARKPKRNVKRLRVYEKALEYVDLEGGETVIDAYCGTGTISLCLAKKAKRVIGIEIVKPAIEDAKKNAKKNHMENTEFYAADAGKLMPQLYRKGLVPDVIVMDPVRAGCSEEVLKAAAGMNPKRIVYVSCNPATFARDAKILKSEGYEIKKVQPVDMFPQTMHVETVCLSLKEKNKSAISFPKSYTQNKSVYVRIISSEEAAND